MNTLGKHFIKPYPILIIANNLPLFAPCKAIECHEVWDGQLTLLF